jgi:type IV pilus assembly protein PilB
MENLIFILACMNNRLTTGDRPSPQDVQAVEWLSQLMLKGLELKASDIHLEPFENLLRVRFRRDGVLYEMPSPPAALREQIISRIKVQSRLDIAEKRLPQDGRMQLPLERRLVDMRVSSLPTLHGEKIVLRILDLQTHQLGFEALGLGELEREHVLQAIAKPNGMVLITGPTGSGKTVTLYTCLNHLNTTGVNIATVEDPSEIVLPGANQVNVNERIGLTFDAALRALLRQDPDILMVGEIRDLATADIAVKASQTGHLVLSTLHTNDAPSTLTRLNHLGIAGFNLASSVVLICAQRLVRRLCSSCKQPLADGNGYQAIGCTACIDGYQGRVAIHQVMPITAGLQKLILEQASAQALAAQAALDGVRTLRQAGMRKVASGETTLQEVLAATHG